jgi:hypothetical protein
MTCYKYETGHYLRARHIGACDGTECAGCEPCPNRHCTDCTKTHLKTDEETCPNCISKTRTKLRELVDLYATLPDEAQTRGVNSEAANLHGPAADAEAFAWRRAARALRDNVLLSTLEPDDEHHPLSVLGRWVALFGESYNEPTNLKLTVTRAVDYLDRRLARFANDPDQDWRQFATEIRRCKTHMESVLHDQGMGDPANIGCFECGAGLERRLTDRGFEDHWTCKGCRRKYTYAEYNFALRAALEEKTA